MAKLSTQGYKGTRDFYPEDMRLQRYIFDVWRRVSERFGYEEYTAPLLEATDLYRAKTGEEIVNEQIYNFTDRGGRDVTIRPEMTPSLARMVAARQQELRYPLRWYSIPNLWRYERPQHGRLREHWQLNVDLFGIEDTTAEFEVIRLAHGLMREFGAGQGMFTIKLNHRELMSYIFGEYLQLNVDASHRLEKLLDRKDKMSQEAFTQQAEAILGDKLSLFQEVVQATKLKDLPEQLRESAPAVELRDLARRLHTFDVANIQFDLTIQRGFDYYTGIIFEVFDTNPENPRSIFGGGRYDDLLSIFNAPRVPAVGFGMGDVGTLDFLRTHDLVPELTSTTIVYVASVEPDYADQAEQIAAELREHHVPAAVDTTGAKIGAKIKTADKKSVPYVIIVGEQETTTGTYTLRDLAAGEEQSGSIEELIAHV